MRFRRFSSKLFIHFNSDFNTTPKYKYKLSQCFKYKYKLSQCFFSLRKSQYLAILSQQIWIASCKKQQLTITFIYLFLFFSAVETGFHSKWINSYSHLIFSSLPDEHVLQKSATEKRVTQVKFLVCSAMSAAQ